MTLSPHMRQALQLARRALGSTSPNPPVGAVIVRHGRAVGQGYTQPPPGPHAEVVALQQAGRRARGAALYVTLEPCRHYGRTAPCTEAILKARLREVHMPLLDPDPQVNGSGKAALEAAGLAVTVGDGQQEARRLLEAYIKHRTVGLPFVIAKFAASLDGRIAAAGGDSRWISGERARAWAHRLRAQVDAIAVGSGAVLIDNPLLTARPRGRPARRQPLRVILDTRGRTPPTAQVFSVPAPLLIATSQDSPAAWRSALQAAGAELLILPKEGSHIDLVSLLRLLAQRGIVSLLVEGGGLLLGSFFDQRLVDKVHAIIAPMIIGAGDAPTPVAGDGAFRMADVLRLRNTALRHLGEDLLVTGYPQVSVSDVVKLRTAAG